MPYSSASANPEYLLCTPSGYPLGAVTRARLAPPFLDNVGNIILWITVEYDLGIIAGSMPMLRKLVRSLAKDESSYVHNSTDINLVTIGSIQGKHHPIHDADIQITVAASDENDLASGHSAKGDESTKQMIRVMRTFNQLSTRRDEEFVRGKS